MEYQSQHPLKKSCLITFIWWVTTRLIWSSSTCENLFDRVACKNKTFAVFKVAAIDNPTLEFHQQTTRVPVRHTTRELTRAIAPRTLDTTIDNIICVSQGKLPLRMVYKLITTRTPYIFAIKKRRLNILGMVGLRTTLRELCTKKSSLLHPK